MGLEKELPGMKDAESLNMLLHGVSFEDVHRHNEILLLEMCADIIAEECNIPRECITNMAFNLHRDKAAEAEREAAERTAAADKAAKRKAAAERAAAEKAAAEKAAAERAAAE